MSLAFLRNPGRLLRERWPSAEALSLELFAMFNAKGESQLDDTLTIRVPEGKPALRIERDRSTSPPAPEVRIGGVTKNSVSTTPGTPGRRLRPVDVPDLARPTSGIIADPASPRLGDRRDPPALSPPQRRSSPLVEIDGGVAFTGAEPVQFSQMPVFVNPRTGEPSDFADELRRRERLRPNFGGGEPGASPLMGVVLDGQGDTYTVTIYPDGPSGAAGKSVTVKVPQIADSEVIPAGTWLSAIVKYKDGYWCQPPVWID